MIDEFLHEVERLIADDLFILVEGNLRLEIATEYMRIVNLWSRKNGKLNGANIKYRQKVVYLKVTIAERIRLYVPNCYQC